MSDTRRERTRDGLDPEDLSFERGFARVGEQHLFPVGSPDEFLGGVYYIADGVWGFEAPTSTDHPGACVKNTPSRAASVLVQGRGMYSAHAREKIAEVIEPTPANGLKKATAFELSPTWCPWARLSLFHQDRRIGVLDLEDRDRILQKLLLLFPDELA